MEPNTHNDMDISTITRSNYVRNRTVHFIWNDEIVGKTLYQGNYWEEWMFPLIQKYYRPGTNMIDIGSYIVTTAMLMEEVLTERNQIYAFEPVFHRVTWKNIEENGLQNRIVLHTCGLSNRDCYYKMPAISYDDPKNYGATSLTLFDTVDDQETGVIPVKRLDDFQIKNVGLIKIDVEHMEIPTLEGAIETIEQYRPVILIESYFVDKLRSSDVFRQMEKSCGYTIHPALPDIPIESCVDFIMIPDQENKYS